MSWEEEIREIENVRAKVNRWLMPQMVGSPEASIGTEVRRSLDVAVGLLKGLDDRGSR